IVLSGKHQLSVGTHDFLRKNALSSSSGRYCCRGPAITTIAHRQHSGLLTLHLSYDCLPAARSEVCMILIISAIQVLILVLAAPLLRGVIAKLKAIIQRRQGASIWRPYADLWKLFHKEDLVPKTATMVFRGTPAIG